MRRCFGVVAVAGVAPFASLDWFWASVCACALLLGSFAAVELGARARRRRHTQ
jgi:hypothetical protein